MKLYFMLLLSAIFSQQLFAQNANPGKDIISIRDLKLSFGGNLEAGTLLNIKMPGMLTFLKKNEGKKNNGLPYRAIGLTIDMHSTHLLIGLMSGFDQSVSKFGLYNHATGFRDFFVISKIEIPLYLKLRSGTAASRGHFWGIIGGIYNVVQETERREYSGNFAMTTTLLDRNKQQAQNYLALSGGMGYDLFLDPKTKHLKLAFFSRFSASLRSELNGSYPWSRPGGKCVLVGTDADTRNARLTAGIKLMYQL